MSQEAIKLKRACEVVVVPYGTRIMLDEGVEVTIMQALGGSYTVTTERGEMVRIDAKDADAIGKAQEQEIEKSSEELEKKPAKDQIWELLKTCYDPEIPCNIVDLGLIYKCDIQTPDAKEDAKEDEGLHVVIELMLTAPGCGMGDILKEDVTSKLMSVSGVKSVDVELIMEPAWDQDRMSEAAKVKLGMM